MSTSALFGIYAAEQGRLRALVRRITGNREAAEDVVHDAMLKLAGRNVGAGDVGLVVRTAQNLARDAMRAERVRAVYAQKVAPEQVGGDVVKPDEAVAARQELDALLAALRSLPDRTRRVFLLNKVDGVPYPEIARSLGVSVSTVEKDMICALDFCREWRRRRDV